MSTTVQCFYSRYVKRFQGKLTCSQKEICENPEKKDIFSFENDFCIWQLKLKKKSQMHSRINYP